MVLSKKKLLVIGDSDNDRAMFNFGHHTVAMKMQDKKLKILQMILPNTRTKEDGAAHYLKSHLLDN